MSIADTADRHALYEHAVQSPAEEVDFVTKQFKRMRGRKPLRLREDFCGTGHFLSTWLRSDPQRTATGVDLHRPTLDYGLAHHVTEDIRARAKLLAQDVREPVRGPFDVAVAYNYSWWVFKQPAHLQSYFRSVHRSLVKDGLYFLDIFGGNTAMSVNLEPRKYRGFTYIWEQASFNPINNDFTCHIHFQFKDGSQLTRAFSYNWRLWQLAEARDHLLAAGFSQVRIFWEIEGGTFRERKVVENEPSYNAYIIAEP